MRLAFYVYLDETLNQTTRTASPSFSFPYKICLGVSRHLVIEVFYWEGTQETAHAEIVCTILGVILAASLAGVLAPIPWAILTWDFLLM